MLRRMWVAAVEIELQQKSVVVLVATVVAVAGYHHWMRRFPF